ncbi:interleukin-1 receptor-like 1 [Clinocottus analis]|uniref:interleukin-1 receptor-like 1 n=1 Tax=Clinocottus analis TaxID=304258 RepID=UPI0035BFC4C2
MDCSSLLLLVVTVMITSECSGSAEPRCEGFDVEPYKLLEGQALHFVPYALESDDMDDPFTWFRKNIGDETENITTNEEERVHHHGGALFLLNPLVTDSGFYTARQHASSGRCYEYYLNVTVFKANRTYFSKVLFLEIKNSDENKHIPCPDPIRNICTALDGSFTWSKDSKLLEGRDKDHLWIDKASRADEGIYTCNCSWTHGGREFTSSGSRWLRLEDQGVHQKVVIISGGDEQLMAEEGAGIALPCSVFCGINVRYECDAGWWVDGVEADGIDRYSVATETVNQSPSSKTVSTAILTIDKVSAEDFNATFECRGQGIDTSRSSFLTLKRRESIVPLLLGGVCVLCLCVFAAALVKCFAIDLLLFFRACFPLSRCDRDGRLFDAYVVYQTQSPDKVTEDALCQFLAKVLPSVLEDKCGYRLFIHGRDDVPGEDRMELVEDRMKQSRRLMVILTPGSGSESQSSDQHSVSPQNSEIGGFDWQVGLHHALMQREMSVILIQLGDPGPQGYAHLPAGLQHLILKSAPIRWPQGSRGAAAWNSRFWKRVRYLMPNTPAKRCPASAVV